MSKHPYSMPKTPAFDLLTGVMDSLRLRTRLFKEGSYSGAWALDARGVDRAVFHLIGRGQCWLHREGREPLELRGGDLVMFPHADWHQLSGTSRRARRPTLRPSPAAGPFTTVFCAVVESDVDAAANPILRALPSVVVVRSEAQDCAPQVRALAQAMLAEYEAGRAGRQAILRRLVEALFVLIVRHHLENAPELRGFLAALRDERIARALSLFHAAPGEDWGVERLAREAGLSRTVFAQRFVQLLDRTPMQYVAAWRMQTADLLLRERRHSVAAIAERMGYGTEASFRRAFKRVRGTGPGRIRRAGSVNARADHRDPR
jgi:AraC-like DNA-binding protein